MTTKEKVVRKSIELAKKEIAGIKAVIDARPHVELMELHKDVKEKKVKLGWASAEFDAVLHAAIKREQELKKLIKQQGNMEELIERRVKLEMELVNLGGELYWIEQRKNKNY